MALVYSGGTLINRAYSTTLAQDNVNNTTQALLDAGWTTISGTPGSSADVTQESLANNVGAKIRVRCRDSGAGNMAVTLKHPTGASSESSGIFCKQTGTWRILASARTFFTFIIGSANKQTNRGMVAAGVLWTPTFLNIASGEGAGWLGGAGINDGDANARNGWRTAIRPTGSFDYSGSSIMGNVTSNSGLVGFCPWQGGGQSGDHGHRWEDNTEMSYEALVAMNYGGGAEDKIHGQLYDAAVINGTPLVGESTLLFESHTWMMVTDGPQPGSAQSCGLAFVLT